MIYTKLTKQALKLCFNAHKDQIDKTGLPYVFHPFYLATQMEDEYTTVIALLHDVIEDTSYTLLDLKNMGYPKDIIDALECLTHQKNIPYINYIQKIKTNSYATIVKLADLKHNSDLNRLDIINDNDLQRYEKYQQAIKILEK